MVELGKISKYRSELMGFAIIIVMLFHVPLSRLDPFFGLRRMGNLGVDIFFFLSGIGLWYSWAKQQDWRRFYLNRALRIYPAWLIVAGYFYISRFHGTTTASYVDLAGDIIVNWDFWLHDELTFWYVPATMMLYLFAPPYMELVRRHPIYRWLVVLPLMWCIIVQYVAPVHQAVGHIEIFWSRVPIFFLGINFAEAVRQKREIDKQAWWMIIGLFALSLWACIWLEQMRHGRFPLYTERMLYIVLAITTILIMSKVFDWLCGSKAGTYVNKWFAWVGGISLEIYLVHVQFVLNPLQQYRLGYWPTFFATLAISLPVAWIISKVCSVVINKLKTKI
ncbi:MAG: acyltransferase [Prevotella sp.]|jgi:peptidoglycan/LPS O-acetylase OafA/YrhL|nr:acyltransferase [Prevotella sp.]